MSNPKLRSSMQGASASRLLTTSIATLVAAGLLIMPFVQSAGASSSQMHLVNVSGFPGALANQASKTLYVLSVEKGAKLKCKGSCLSAWIPLTVKDSVSKVSLGADVKGKIGFVARSSTTKQITFNSFPLYTFAGDSAARESNGEGKSFDGGKWYIVKAASTSPGTTPIVKAASSGGAGTTTTTHPPTTTTTPPTTTTTLGGGGGGY